jgi:hypothetical protein
MRKPAPKTPGFVKAAGQYCPSSTKNDTVDGITDPEKCAAVCKAEKGCNAFTVPSNRKPESYFKYVGDGLKDDMSCRLFYDCEMAPMPIDLKTREVTTYFKEPV